MPKKFKKENWKIGTFLGTVQMCKMAVIRSEKRINDSMKAGKLYLGSVSDMRLKCPLQRPFKM